MKGKIGQATHTMYQAQAKLTKVHPLPQKGTLLVFQGEKMLGEGDIDKMNADWFRGKNRRYVAFGAEI